MPNWIRIAAVTDCPPGESLETVAGDRIVALFNVEGNLHAMDGICSHQGGPLGKGTLSGCVVTCPWHGWQYDVTTGRHELIETVRQTAFPVKVEGEDVFVDIDAG